MLRDRTLNPKPSTIKSDRQRYSESAGICEKATSNELELALVNKHNEIEKHRAEATGGMAPELRKVFKKIVFEGEPEVIELIEELKSLLSHKIIDGNLNQVLKEALPLAIREIKIKKGLVKRTSAPKPSTETSSMMAQEAKSPEIAKKVTRSIPNRINHLVWERDQGRCQFRDPLTNKICGSTFQVEFDHLRPWSCNGEHSVENITTSCKSHILFRWQSVERMNFDTKAE